VAVQEYFDPVGPDDGRSRVADDGRGELRLLDLERGEPQVRLDLHTASGERDTQRDANRHEDVSPRTHSPVLERSLPSHFRKRITSPWRDLPSHRGEGVGLMLKSLCNGHACLAFRWNARQHPGSSTLVALVRQRPG